GAVGGGARRGARGRAGRAAQLSSHAGSEQKLEVFVNLARRLQSLVHREISILDDLENEIEDPDLLKGLFHVDHLATRIRRHAENLAVLGGAVSRRQWSNPVSMTEVLRSAIAEVEQYSRVKLVPPIDGELRGHAVADVIHLLAELIENASVFSAPHTQVLLRANLVTSGLAVEVEDRGLGMPVGEQHRMNALLADPDQVNVASLLSDGRIGLYVVSQLARRHGIHVRLQTNIYGGVQAVLVVPQALLGTAPGPPGAAAGAGAGVPQPQPQDPADTGASPQVRPQGQEYGSEQMRGPVPASASASASAASGAEAAAGTVVPSGGEAGTDTGQAPATGRRRHAQRGNGRYGADSEGEQSDVPSGRGYPGDAQVGGGPLGAEREDGGGGATAPAPLPVRGARQERPTPAEAVPGIRAEDRTALEAHTGILPTPRVGTVRGTVGKPQLPRRRAQEHIVPQLRGGPAPRQDDDTVPGHDPGLMAAFQRGIGLAEAQQHLESQETAHLHSGHPDTGPVDTSPLDSVHMDSAHMGSAHTDSAAHLAPVHMDVPHMMGHHLRPAVPEYTDLMRAQPDHMGPDHTDPASISEGRTHAPASDGAYGAGRPDGSAPAG
ncbi:ATP-binding protein, partial [Streptomyces sp. NPDC052101]|uniref:sensor histidine kinase n=1 Tax=Streptomyces sp. NPDC052101 TaxID=3155763 RepID=UPI00342C5214